MVELLPPSEPRARVGSTNSIAFFYTHHIIHHTVDTNFFTDKEMTKTTDHISRHRGYLELLTYRLSSHPVPIERRPKTTRTKMVCELPEWTVRVCVWLHCSWTWMQWTGLGNAESIASLAWVKTNPKRVLNTGNLVPHVRLTATLRYRMNESAN